MTRIAHTLIGLAVFFRESPPRNERGLSQSAENAILLAGAVVIAGVIISVMTAYVTGKLPK